MNIKIFGLILGGMLISPSLSWAQGSGQEVQTQMKSHIEQRKQESHPFQNLTKGMNPDEKKQAVKQHRGEEYQKNMSAFSQHHLKKMNVLKEKLAKNTKLTDDQKQDLLNFYEQQYQEMVAHHQGQYIENTQIFEQIANQPNLSQDQRKQMIKKHFQQQKQENQAFHKQEQGENQAEKQLIIPTVKSLFGL